jgi:hypothetical protein
MVKASNLVRTILACTGHAKSYRPYYIRAGSLLFSIIQCILFSVGDPDSNTDPEPSDPYVFGPPGSGSGAISQRYESGSGSVSGSFYHQAKIVGKTLVPTGY